MRFAYSELRAATIDPYQGDCARAYAFWVALAGEGAQSFTGGSTTPWMPTPNGIDRGTKAKPPVIRGPTALLCAPLPTSVPE